MAPLPPPSEWTGERVRALRARLGLSPLAFAEALGLTRQKAVLDMEAGRTHARRSTARLLDAIDRGGVDAVRPPRVRTNSTPLDQIKHHAFEIERIAASLG